MGIRQVQSPWLTDVIATVDATPTVSAAASQVIATGVAGYVDIHYVVIGANAATVATGTKRIPFRNNAGALTLLTAIVVIAIAGDAGILTAVVDATSSGTTVQPRVTGIAATNLTFMIDCRYSMN